MRIETEGVDEPGAAFSAAELGFLDQFDIAVVVCDLDSRIVFWNRSAEAMYGYGRDEALGESVLALVMPPVAVEDASLLASTARDGSPWSGRVAVQRKDGSPMIVDLRLTPWLLEGGERVGSIGVSFDVTERVLAERRLEAHARLARAISDELPVEAAAGALFSGVAEAVSTSGGTLWGADDTSLSLLAAVPADGDAAADSLAGELARQAATSGKQARSADGAVLAYPLGVRGDPAFVVVVALDGPLETRLAFELLPPIGRQFAQYAARKEGESELRRSEEHLALLAELSAVLAQSLDYNETLAAIARVVVSRLADWCLIDLVAEDGEIERAFVAHEDADKVAWARELQARKPASRETAPTGVPNVLRTGEPELHDSITSEAIEASLGTEAEMSLVISDLGLTSAIIVPIAARDEPMGALTLMRTAASARRFSEDDLLLAIQVGRRAGMAIENARLYDAQRATLHRLQSALLPSQLPIVPSVSIAARYRPGSEEAEIGGDFYDVFQVADGAWIAVVGDVSGKGIDAASQAGLVRHTVKASALIGSRPSELLSIVNRAMEPETGDDWFATLVCARIEPRSDGGLSVVLSCAGHPRPLVLRADRSVEELDIEGVPVGFLAAPSYSEAELVLLPGETLILYTDGISEARRDGRMFGADGVMAVVRRSESRDAEALASEIERVSTGFGDEMSTPDDLATLVIRVHGADEVDRSSTAWSAVTHGGAVESRTILVLPADPRAAAYARRGIDELGNDLPEQQLADARLMLDELVNNALVHASPERIVVELERVASRLRCSVIDDGPGFMVARPVPPPSGTAESGYGLYLVEQLSHRFGVDRSKGTRTWFELNLAPEFASGAAGE